MCNVVILCNVVKMLLKIFRVKRFLDFRPRNFNFQRCFPSMTSWTEHRSVRTPHKGRTSRSKPFHNVTCSSHVQPGGTGLYCASRAVHAPGVPCGLATPLRSRKLCHGPIYPLLPMIPPHLLLNWPRTPCASKHPGCASTEAVTFYQKCSLRMDFPDWGLNDFVSQPNFCWRINCKENAVIHSEQTPLFSPKPV